MRLLQLLSACLMFWVMQKLDMIHLVFFTTVPCCGMLPGNHDCADIVCGDESLYFCSVFEALLYDNL